MSSIVGPIAPYSNVPIHPLYYSPRIFFITNVTLGFTTTVTTSVDHDYSVGEEIRLLIPPGYGCRQLNNQTGFVVSIPSSDQIELDIYSVGIDSFVTPASSIQQPQTIPVGDINSGVRNDSGSQSLQTFIPGSFINVSPA